MVFSEKTGRYDNNFSRRRQFLYGLDSDYKDLTTGISRRFYARHPKFKWFDLEQDDTPVADVILNFKVLMPRLTQSGYAVSLLHLPLVQTQVC